MASREKAIDRIRKLLALAERAAGNEHEAANAAAEVARLMARHGIDSVDVEGDPDPVGDNQDLHVQVCTARRLPTWKWNLAWVVAGGARCKPYALDHTLGDHYVGKSVAFLGRRTDAELCTQLFRYLLVECKRLHDERRPTLGSSVMRYIPGQPPPIVDRPYQQQWSRNFYLGIITSIAARMQQATEEVMQEASSTALVRIDGMIHAVDELAAHMRLRYQPSRGVTVSSHAAFVAGVNVGEKIDLRGAATPTQIPGRTRR